MALYMPPPGSSDERFNWMNRRHKDNSLVPGSNETGIDPYLEELSYEQFEALKGARSDWRRGARQKTYEPESVPPPPAVVPGSEQRGFGGQRYYDAKYQVRNEESPEEERRRRPDQGPHRGWKFVRFTPKMDKILKGAHAGGMRTPKDRTKTVFILLGVLLMLVVLVGGVKVFNKGNNQLENATRWTLAGDVLRGKASLG